MSNDSTAAGYLTQLSEDPAYDETLEQLLSQWIKALSGLPDDMVKPRWMPVQEDTPAADVNWCGFGIVGIQSDDNPHITSPKDDESDSELWRNEVIECEASFYGPGGQGIVTRFRDGMTISQNNATLNTVGLSLADYSPVTSSPELINDQWVRRYDITTRLRRKVIREYGIKSLLSAPFTISGE